MRATSGIRIVHLTDRQHDPRHVRPILVRALLATLRAEPARHLGAAGVLVLEIGHERDHFEAAFPELEPVWLPTSAGDDPVLLLTREALAP